MRMVKELLKFPSVGNCSHRCHCQWATRWQCSAVQHGDSTVRFSTGTVKCSATRGQYSAVHAETVQYNATLWLYSAVQHGDSVVQCTRWQYSAVLRSALHGHICAIHISAVQYRSMKPSAVQCSTVYGFVVHFSAVQHKEIYCIALQFSEV